MICSTSDPIANIQHDIDYIGDREFVFDYCQSPLASCGESGFHSDPSTNSDKLGVALRSRFALTSFRTTDGILHFCSSLQMDETKQKD